MPFACPRNTRGEEGVALLLSLLVLVLISALAAALLFMAANESSIVSNQRSEATAWDAARAGLEEARGRISAGDTNYLGTNLPANTSHVLYILNPASGETVAPTDASNAYFDSEYQTEWGQPITSSTLTVTTVNSELQSLLSAGTIPTVPAYKWVRITLKTEASANEDVNEDGALDSTSLLTFSASTDHQAVGGSASQVVYRTTALASISGGTERILQYDLGPGFPLPPFPAALTMCGPDATYNGPSSNVWYANGADQGSPPSSSLEAIGTCNSSSTTDVDSGVPSDRTTHYTGASGLIPDVVNVSSSINPCFTSVTCLNSLVTTLTGSASQVLTGPVSNPNLGSDASPRITVVNGNLILSGTTIGAGILVVTGTLTTAGNTTFDGVILVIGQGQWVSNGGGNGVFNGGVVVSKTLDSNGHPLSTLGTPSVNWSGGGGNGIYYNSSWVNETNNMFRY